jgi:hemoglobin-like flavoprotein
VPPLFADVIDRCLQRDPEQRFASGVELVQALEEGEQLLRLLQRSPSTPVGSDGRLELAASSFRRLEGRAKELTRTFYEHLFAARPDLEALFPRDMSEQRLKLAGALQLALEHLERPERLTPLLEELGRRHAPYGVREEDFDAVGKALLSALALHEGNDWNARLADAWSHAYDLIATAMLRGLRAGGPAWRPNRAP